MTSCPRCTSSRAPAGVSATRYSSVLISFATPIFTAAHPTLSTDRHAFAASASPLRSNCSGSVDLEGQRDASPTPWVGAAAKRCPVRRRLFGRRGQVRLAQVQEQDGEGLRVLELVQVVRDLPRIPADELELFVRLWVRIASFDTFGEEEMHPLAAKAGRRVEDRQLTPRAAGEPGFLGELTASAREWFFVRLERAGRQLDQRLAHSFPPLAHERDQTFPVNRDDRDGAWMLDDLPLVFAPALDRDVEQLPVVHGACRIWLQAPKRTPRAARWASLHLAAAAIGESYLRVRSIPQLVCCSIRACERAHWRRTSSRRFCSSELWLAPNARKTWRAETSSAICPWSCSTTDPPPIAHRELRRCPVDRMWKAAGIRRYVRPIYARWSCGCSRSCG